MSSLSEINLAPPLPPATAMLSSTTPSKSTTRRLGSPARKMAPPAGSVALGVHDGAIHGQNHHVATGHRPSPRLLLLPQHQQQQQKQLLFHYNSPEYQHPWYWVPSPVATTIHRTSTTSTTTPLAASPYSSGAAATTAPILDNSTYLSLWYTPEWFPAMLYRLQQQVEFYFSPANLARDDYLMQHLVVYKGRVPCQVVGSFPRVVQIVGGHPASPLLLARSLATSNVVRVYGPYLCPVTPVGHPPPGEPRYPPLSQPSPPSHKQQQRPLKTAPSGSAQSHAELKTIENSSETLVIRSDGTPSSSLSGEEQRFELSGGPLHLHVTTADPPQVFTDCLAPNCPSTTRLLEPNDSSSFQNETDLGDGIDWPSSNTSIDPLEKSKAMERHSEEGIGRRTPNTVSPSESHTSFTIELDVAEGNGRIASPERWNAVERESPDPPSEITVSPIKKTPTTLISGVYCEDRRRDPESLRDQSSIHLPNQKKGLVQNLPESRHTLPTVVNSNNGGQAYHPNMSQSPYSVASWGRKQPSIPTINSPTLSTNDDDIVHSSILKDMQTLDLKDPELKG